MYRNISTQMECLLIRVHGYCSNHELAETQQHHLLICSCAHVCLLVCVCLLAVNE